MTGSIINADDPRWPEFLSKTEHDFYHLPDYTQLEAKPGEEALAYLSDNCLIPFLLKPIAAEPGFYDAQSTYGYPGPLFTEPSATIDGCVQSLSDLNVVSLFLRLHPILNRDVSPLSKTGTLVQHGETISIDTTKTDEEMWAETRDNHRRGIKSLLKEGATVEVDENWTAFGEFHSCYIQTMARVNAGKFYFFPEEYFQRLRQITRLYLCVVRIGGVVACGGVFSDVGGLMQYHLGGTADPFLKETPSKLMFHHMRSFARNHGIRRLHLGGGVGGQADSLFNFKLGFSKSTHPFFTWRLPVRQEKYDKLTVDWESSSKIPADSISGFFPPYRKPIVNSQH